MKKSCGPRGAPGYFQYFIRDIMLSRIGRHTAEYLDNILAYKKKGVNHGGKCNISNFFGVVYQPQIVKR